MDNSKYIFTDAVLTGQSSSSNRVEIENRRLRMGLLVCESVVSTFETCGMMVPAAQADVAELEPGTVLYRKKSCLGTFTSLYVLNV